MNFLIDDAQSSFLSERLITDNVIIVFEIFHSLQANQKQNQSFVALKLDMNKAFDKVEWGFSEVLRKSMLFPDYFLSLVVKCISTVTFYILINRMPTRTFVPTRGIQQGDSLSP